MVGSLSVNTNNVCGHPDQFAAIRTWLDGSLRKMPSLSLSLKTNFAFQVVNQS